ncbi:hypothetical protein VCHA38P217_40176 [Vibrio chagasii]|nr:hypothetical protein VCHA34P115_110050 [Vibrio chagasii]CAH6832680.1 hypothetical protein VCHA36O157_10049 [Vibrio chagasii]CAH6992095.1 hypothetical protein VCHA34P120_40178 [Vibrio chagasii]CAH7048760.1 hypothetical protein VCHA43O270_10357 [Vibrio chagasii]CAH7174585.1 hypothetical protein VCHA41O249_20313 [Vibrio chagasii]
MNDWAFLYPKSSQAFVSSTVKRNIKKRSDSYELNSNRGALTSWFGSDVPLGFDSFMTCSTKQSYLS